MKTTFHASPLAAKVAAVNAVAAEINRLSPLMIEALRPFIGKKVIKTTDRRFTAAVLAVLPAQAEGIERWLAHADSGICFTIKTSRQTRDRNCPEGEQWGIAHYAEDWFYVGEVDSSGTLIKVLTPSTRRADWTEAGIVAARKAVEVAREAVREANTACGPFGDYDR